MGGDLESGVQIPAAGVILDGDLVEPPGAAGVVVFAHGSGSSDTARGTAWSRQGCRRQATQRCLWICSPPRRSRSTTGRGHIGSTSLVWRHGSSVPFGG